ncbi:MAG: PAS domain S-box protein [Leptospirales bacterium]|nr:PAS domain S-box protein [Leptospirales bacterium]
MSSIQNDARVVWPHNQTSGFEGRERSVAGRILIVEDSSTQAAALRALLESAGFEIELAGDGPSALTALPLFHPDLVITDIVMPGMTGFELCSRIKAEAEWSQTPVMLLTSLNDTQDIIHALECGADNFLTKPYNVQYLVSRIRQLMASLELRQGGKMQLGVELIFGNRRHFITAERQQILDLLLSTYEAAQLRNSELARASDELQVMNERLEELVQERTAQLNDKVHALETTQTALQAEKEFTTHVVQSSPLLIVELDAMGHILFINGAVESMLGYHPEECLGKAWSDLMRGEALLGRLKVQLEDAGAARPQSKELAARHRDGTERIIAWTALPPLKRGGDPGCMAIGLNLTDLRQAERENQKQERLFRDLLESAPDAMVIVDQRGVIEIVNSQAERLFGCRREELLGQPMDMLLPDEEREAYRQRLLIHFSQNAEGQAAAAVELYGRKSDGRKFPVEVSLSPIRSGETMLVASAIRDISDRRAAERALRERDRQLHETQELARISGWEIDSTDDRHIWTAEALQLLGLQTADSACGIDGLLELLDAEGREQVESAYRELVNHLVPFILECRVVRENRPDQWLQMRGVVVSEDGGRQRLAGTIQDVTERMELTLQLNQSAKLATLGEMATGVAHELNQPLNAIRISSTMVRDALAAEDLDREFIAARLDRIQDMVDRMSRFVSHMRTFGRKSGQSRVNIDPNQPIRSALEFLEQKLKNAGVEVDLQLSDGLPLVLADAINFEQVYINLIVNALHALELRSDSETEPRLILKSETSGERIITSVANNGPAIPASVLPRIFEPFFTTKEAGKGTGLGLSISFNLIQSHGGELTVESDDHWTVFRISLPALAAREAGRAGVFS